MGRATVLLHHTPIRHHGQPVTVLGVPACGLLVLAGYSTPTQRVLGIITVIERAGGPAYRVFGLDEDLPDLDAAAAAVANRRRDTAA
jgi:hypothetical protein